MSDNEEETVVLSNKQLTEALKSLTNKIDILINNSSNNNNNKEKHSSSETSTTHPYGLTDEQSTSSGKKRKESTAPVNSTQSKKLRPQEEEVPYLSLPEEDEMERNVRNLLGTNDIESEQGSRSDSDQDNNCDEIFKELSEEINNDEDKGPAIEDKLKTCFNSIWQNPLKKDKYKDKLKQYKIPRNVEVKVKKCNEEIWKNKMATKTKTADLKLQKIQKALTKTSAAIIDNVTITKKFIEQNQERYLSRKCIKEHLETSIKSSLDAITLLASASAYTDEVRRDSIVEKLPYDIKNCINASDPNHSSEKLFGDQLTKKISEWKKSMKTVDNRWSTREPKNWRELESRGSKNSFRPRKVHRGYQKSYNNSRQYQRKQKKKDD